MPVNEFQILLIDDDEDDYVHIRDLFSDIKHSKYKITWKPDYKEGRAALLTDAFDACLLDYRLGELTGLDLLKEIVEKGANCPIIVLTGQGDMDIDIQAMQAGASDYLVKDQLTSHLLERSIRYSIKHYFDMIELRKSEAQIIQQDRMASLGLLASSLAHEIGTPLGIIRSRAELAEKKIAEDSPLKENMRIIVSQIDKIAKLVNSLLHLARAKNSESTVSVYLNQVIQDVLSLVKHELDRKDISLEANLDKDYRVKAESGSLGQVLLNLIVNAIHAIEEAKENGMSTRHQIKLTVDDCGEFIKILVQDSGGGIPAENISQLFKPFFTTKKIGQGTGLGLAVSYKLVQSWGGMISVHNGDRGAIFEINLLKH